MLFGERPEGHMQFSSCFSEGSYNPQGLLVSVLTFISRQRWCLSRALGCKITSPHYTLWEEVTVAYTKSHKDRAT